MNAAVPFDVFRIHGGKVAAARASFPEAPAPWIDLSTGISPWPYAHETLPSEAFMRLPDADAVAALEAAAAETFAVTDAARVVATPGSDLALRLLGRLFAGRRVAVVRPGYSGHVLAWDGAPITSIPASDIESVARDHEVVVLANPNNPDGRLIQRDRLLAVAHALRARGGVLVVDEAFADMVPESSLASVLDGRHAEEAGSIVLFRSFGKFFGLAGVRLGFVIAAPQRVRAFRHALGDWPVSGPAVAIGAAAYRDRDWQSMQRHRLTAAAARLDALLTRAGFTIVGGTPLFRLARCSDADVAFRHFAAHGILTRPFAGDSTLLRVGLPADESHWQRLAAALASRPTHE